MITGYWLILPKKIVDRIKDYARKETNSGKFLPRKLLECLDGFIDGLDKNSPLYKLFGSVNGNKPKRTFNKTDLSRAVNHPSDWGIFVSGGTQDEERKCKSLFELLCAFAFNGKTLLESIKEVGLTENDLIRETQEDRKLRESKGNKPRHSVEVVKDEISEDEKTAAAISGHWQGGGTDLDVKKHLGSSGIPKYRYKADLNIRVVAKKITIEGHVTTRDIATGKMRHKDVHFEASGRLYYQNANLTYEVDKVGTLFSTGVMSVKFENFGSAECFFVVFRADQDGRGFAGWKLFRTGD